MVRRLLEGPLGGRMAIQVLRAGRRDPLAVPRQCLQRSFLFALGLQKGEAASSEEA